MSDYTKHKHDAIEKFIMDFREKNWEYFFLHWWCYIFVRILKTMFWWVIYSNCDHCVLNVEWLLYDITWQLDRKKNHYSIIDLQEEMRYIQYSNFNGTY